MNYEANQDKPDCLGPLKIERLLDCTGLYLWSIWCDFYSSFTDMSCTLIFAVFLLKPELKVLANQTNN